MIDFVGFMDEELTALEKAMRIALENPLPYTVDEIEALKEMLADIRWIMGIGPEP